MSITIGSTLYLEVIGTDGDHYYKTSLDGTTYSDWVKGTVGATTNEFAKLGTMPFTNYFFIRGSTGTEPNLCVISKTYTSPTPNPTVTVTPTPTPVVTVTPTPVLTVTPTPTAPPGTPNPITGCQAGFNSLGGVINSDPSAAVYNGRVFVFARGNRWCDLLSDLNWRSILRLEHARRSFSIESANAGKSRQYVGRKWSERITIPTDRRRRMETISVAGHRDYRPKRQRSLLYSLTIKRLPS